VERRRAKWHEYDARTCVLEAQDESFDYRDAPVLAHGTEPGLDMMPVTPGLERVAPELLALIGDEILRCDACLANGTFEKVLNR
jgi:hypothetical protein